MNPLAPVGAFVLPAGGVEYRVWAPDHPRVQVAIGPDEAAPLRTVEMERAPEGIFIGRDPEGRAGDLYGFRVGGKDPRLPDPASRFQPQGVLGASEVIDPRTYRWQATGWRRPALKGRTIYELHVGTFSPEGTFRGAIGRLDALVELGVNTIELMPVGDFPGRWNWGYDGVMLYAPARCYGRPDDLRALVDAAHERGLAVILDVVYNHFGPIGNPLYRYGGSYHHAEKESPWGRSFNFDGPGSEQVRAFFAGNAVYWLDDYRFDGLRLDATHAIHDASPRHVLAAFAAAAAERGAFTIAEDERNDALVIASEGPAAWNLSAAWADDFHHSVRVALTGARHAYFAGYTGDSVELAELLRHGWLYRGQIFPPSGQPRGTNADALPPEKFVYCLNNHDQTGNRALGERLAALAAPPAYRAACLLLCLAPGTPMFFMGDEWGARTPFLFFTDHPGEIGEKMGEYRRKEFAAQGPEVLARMPDPQAEATFQASRLDWSERTRGPHSGLLQLHREALALRSRFPHFQSPARSEWEVTAAGGAVILRWRTEGGDWLLAVALKPRAPGPLEHGLARPPPGRTWLPVLASEDPRFGGAAAAAGAPTAGVPLLAGPGAVLYREGKPEENA